MRIAYLDCFAGISGDMFLGALLDAGVPFAVLEQATNALNLNATLTTEKVLRSGIACTKVNVLEDGHLAETTHQHPHTSPGFVSRSLPDILRLIQSAPLAEPVKTFAQEAFTLLAAAEARIHNVPADQIHFHEVGAVDAIVDIVVTSAGIAHLGIDAWYCSPVNLGSGTVQCAHGLFPVPAPATAELLRGVPTYAAHLQKELTTPTGAALLRALAPAFGPQPPMQVTSLGYGAGTRNPENFPNALRLSLGETSEDKVNTQDQVTVLETALDDLSPQLLAYVAEQALAAGALDVMLTPVVMKKGRPGTLLTVLCNAETQPALERLILTETTTLGLRIRHDRRSVLSRTSIAVETAYGPIHIKIGTLHGERLNAQPEYEDCRRAAIEHGIALKTVHQAALSAYLKGHPQ